LSNYIDSNPDIIESMKICSTCKQTKIDDEFDFKNKDANIRHARCKPCQREYGPSHYQKIKGFIEREIKGFGYSIVKR
jgi:hypothetical protein